MGTGRAVCHWLTFRSQSLSLSLSLYVPLLFSARTSFFTPERQHTQEDWGGGGGGGGVRIRPASAAGLLSGAPCAL